MFRMPAPTVSTETRRQLKATAGELGAQTLPGAARPLQSGLDLADEAPDNEADSYVKIHQVVDLFFLFCFVTVSKGPPAKIY